MAFKEVYRAGREYENLVVIERRDSSPNLYYRAWNPGKGGYVRRSLRHSDLEAAKVWADEQAAKIRKGQSDIAKGRVTMERGGRLYLDNHTPTKATENERREDRRRVKMFSRVRGIGDVPLEQIKGMYLRAFANARKEGRIDYEGRLVEDEDARDPVRWSTVRSDLKWLRSFLLWLRDDAEVIRQVKVKKKHIPEARPPRRPVATQERVKAIRGVYDEPRMQVSWGGDVRKIQSYLPTVFELVVGSGRRVSKVRTLQHNQLFLDQGRCGKIAWSADRKGGLGNKVDIPMHSRRALDEHLRRMRELLGSRIGEAFVFPGAQDTSQPISQNSINRWLRDAEKKAEVEPHDGSLWHAYRRMWGQARKHLPVHDVARAGGWAGPETLQRVYQRADEAGVSHVVHNPGEVRRVYGEE